MKKTLKSSILFTAYLGLAFLFNCSKKDNSPSPANCESNSTKLTDAATVFAKNPTTANCEAYKNSVRDFYKSCATYYAAAQKKALDDFLAEPCL